MPELSLLRFLNLSGLIVETLRNHLERTGGISRSERDRSSEEAQQARRNREPVYLQAALSVINRDIEWGSDNAERSDKFADSLRRSASTAGTIIHNLTGQTAVF